MAEEVVLLQQFRDEYLLTNRMGQWFVSAYYRYSPPIADYIAQHETLRMLTRVGLTPIVYAVKTPRRALAVFACFIVMTVGLYRWNRGRVLRCKALQERG